ERATRAAEIPSGPRAMRKVSLSSPHRVVDTVRLRRKQICKRVFGNRVRLLLGPVGGVRSLTAAFGLDGSGVLGGDPTPLDQPGAETLDGVVLDGIGDLLFGGVLEVVVLRGVRVDAPDLGVDQGRALAPTGTLDRLPAD